MIFNSILSNLFNAKTLPRYLEESSTIDFLVSIELNPKLIDGVQYIVHILSYYNYLGYE